MSKHSYNMIDIADCFCKLNSPCVNCTILKTNQFNNKLETWYYRLRYHDNQIQLIKVSQSRQTVVITTLWHDDVNLHNMILHFSLRSASLLTLNYQLSQAVKLHLKTQNTGTFGWHNGAFRLYSCASANICLCQSSTKLALGEHLCIQSDITMQTTSIGSLWPMQNDDEHHKTY